MTTSKFKRTKFACYSAYFTMSSVFYLPPLLFVTFHEMYDVSWTLLGTLVLTNFCTQFAIDLIFTVFSKKFNIQKVVKIMPLITSLGLLIYAIFPMVFPSFAYVGLLIGTIIFSVAAGLSEVLLSPMIAAIPSDDPQKDMSLLHSLYAFGVFSVVVIGTLFIKFIGAEYWMYLTMFFAALPVIASVLFIISPMPDMSASETSTSTTKAQKRTMGIALCIGCIFLGSCAENAMSNWISSYMEAQLHIDKAIGDILGMAMFAILLGITRICYAKWGKNICKMLLIGKKIAQLGITPEQVTKALHTMMGIVTIDIIVMTTYIHSFKHTLQKYKGLVITILFYACMSIQVTLLSIKTVNYDLNSLLLALLSIMLMIYEIRENNLKLGLMAIITSMLATQDKMLAGPMLYLSLLVFVIILTIKIQQTSKKVPLCIMTLVVTLIPVLISYISNYYVGIVLANGNIPSTTFYDTVYSYVQYSLTILEAFSDIFKLSNTAVVLNLLILWVIFTIAAYLTSYLIKQEKQFTLWQNKGKTLSVVAIALIMIMLVVAVISIYSNPYIYMSPLYPIEEGNYQSKSLMNGITYHYNAKTMLSHFVKLMGTIIYIFYKSIPVGYMILLVIIGILILKNKKCPDICNISFMLLSAVIFPLLYSAIQITPNERYQNVYILAFAYLVVVTIIEMIAKDKEKLTIIVLAITILNLVDVHRFDYAYTEYFALWDTAYISQQEDCVTGKMVPGYHAAWGEHVIYAGEMIAKYADEQQIPYSDITIHYEYYGQYINNGGMNILVENSKEWETCTIGENDYFVVSRGAATKEQALGISIKLIENATPLFTYGYNGATEMWVYSGSEVARIRE